MRLKNNEIEFLRMTALTAAPDVAEITLSMPNIHYLPINLSHFGLETNDQVFLPTDEPNGHIEATMKRA